jgi:uncharacterized membrane protein (UPF0182 family)
MRAADDMPGLRRPSGRGRVILIVSAVALFLLVTSLRQIAEFWTDLLWFQSVNLQSVWSRTLAAKVGLAVVFVALLFALLWVSLFIVDRLSPVFHPLGPDDELLTRYHQLVDRRVGVLRVIVALVFALITGGGMSSQWNEWLLFTNAVTTGRTDPQFGLDIGFYLFQLPFLTAVVDWLFASLVIVLLVTTVAHYLNGGIRLQASFERVTPQVKAHLSVLLALLALVKAVDYYLQRFQVVFSTRGAVDGASYTEVNAQLPAIHLLIFIAFAAFVLFIVNIRRRGWALPAVAVGLWVFVQLIIGQAYPAVYQRFIVTPEESAKESVAIERNIQATREAYGLDNIDVKDFPVSDSTADGVKAINDNPTITRNVQLLDPDRVLDAFKKKQSLAPALVFNRVATDRYPMQAPDGSDELTQVVIANRELSTQAVPSRSWQSEKLNYTHGYGFALAAGNAVDHDGAPDFAVRGIPIENSPAITLNDSQPDNYYFNQPLTSAQMQPTIPDYSVVGTASPEFDYAPGHESPRTPGDTGGVPVDSFLKRAAFYLRFGDFDLLLSQYINDQSRILFVRDVRMRALAAAPFLAFDSDPYPAVVDGHTVFVLDAYTTSDRYPFSQHYPNERLDLPLLRVRSFNYVRNSVKVVVDSYSGDMTFYVVDETDPIIQAYQSAFPGLFTSAKAGMSRSLREHLRYPEDIFTVQTDMWGRYHIDNTSDFYNRAGAWEPPPRPADQPAPNNTTAGGATGAGGNAAAANQPGSLVDTRSKTKLDRMAPNYVVNRLPDDPRPNFMLMRSYQPYSEDESKQQLTSFVVARCDGDDLGKLEVYQVRSAREVQGSAFVANQMQVDSLVSQKVSLLDQHGSSVLFSDLVLVPIERTLVYVRSMYVVSNETPLVQYVVVASGARIYIEPTLRAALRAAFPNSNPQTWEADRTEQPNGTSSGGSPTTTSPPGTGPPGTGPSTSTPASGGDVQGMLNDAARLFDEARTAQRDNDTALWAQKLKEAEDKVRQAQTLMAGGGGVPTTTTTGAGPPGSTP